MAIFKCKDCGKEVSDKAVACPGCGSLKLLLSGRRERSSPQDHGLGDWGVVLALRERARR